MGKKPTKNIIQKKAFLVAFREDSTKWVQLEPKQDSTNQQSSCKRKTCYFYDAFRDSLLNLFL